MTIENGRPADESGRLEKETAVYDLLEQLDIPFTRADHEPAFTMDACEEVAAALETKICKNLFLCNRQKTSFYLLFMPGDKPFHTKEITNQLGCARLSFAKEEALEQLLHLTPGSATIFGLMYDTENQVQLVVDQELLREPYFGCHPCINTSTVRMQTSDVFDKLTNALHHTYVTVTLKENDRYGKRKIIKTNAIRMLDKAKSPTSTAAGNRRPDSTPA